MRHVPETNWRFLYTRLLKAKAFLIYVSLILSLTGWRGPTKKMTSPAGELVWQDETDGGRHRVHAQTPWAIIRTVLVYGNSLDGTRSNIT
jgi:hypothetical protein